MGGSAPSNAAGGSSNSQLRALEQRLQQLTQEKQKAVKAQNSEQAKKLDVQIQEIRRQIAELSGKENSAKPAENQDQNQEQAKLEKNPTDPSGRKLDELV